MRVGLIPFVMQILFLPFIISQPQELYTYHSYQKGVACQTRHGPPREPKTVEELQRIIAYAIKQDLKVRIIGNLHSISDSICTTGIPIKLSHFKWVIYNSTTDTVRVGTGIEGADFLEESFKQNCSLTGVPSYGGVTVGGLIANGAYGTGAKYPSMLSDQLAAIRFIDGQGRDRFITEADPDFDAFRVSLGQIGAFYEVVFHCQRPYKLKMNNYPASDEILDNGVLMDLVKTTDVVQAWWFPSNKAIILSAGNRTSPSEPGNCQTNFVSNMDPSISTSFSINFEFMQKTWNRVGQFLLQSFSMLSIYKNVPGRQPFFSESDGQTPCKFPAVGWGHRMISNKCTSCAWKSGLFNVSLLEDDTNFTFLLSQLPNAVKIIRRILNENPVSFPLIGLYMRFLSPGKSLMGVNHSKGMDSENIRVSLEWISTPRYDAREPKSGVNALQMISQAMVSKH